MNRSRFYKSDWLTIVVVAVLTLASAVGWLRMRVDTSLEPLLPENSEARQTVLFLRDSTFASKVILWFRLQPGTDDQRLLYTAADEAEKRLDPAMFKRVVRPPKEAAAFDEAVGLLDHAGELLNEKDLAELDVATSPEALKKRMRECFVQLTRPEGAFMQQIIARDPLGVSNRILARLYALTQGLGYKIEVKDGRFIHADGRQMMVVLETASTATSIGSSQSLVAELKKVSDAAPKGVEIVPICAQIHTEENQRLMHDDTSWAGSINGIFFLILFFVVSRDWRVAAIFLTPLLSIVVTLGLCALFLPDLSMIVIGVSMTMAGAAVDYCIFVYTAVRIANTRSEAMKKIRTPLIVSHLTSMGVFLAFLFSTIPAYRQLGIMTGISLVLSLLIALFVLPRVLRPKGRIPLLDTGMPLPRWGRLNRPSVVVACVVLLAAATMVRHVRFDSDISRLDGITAETRENEAAFQRTWARSDAELGIFVVAADTRAKAEEMSDRASRLAGERVTDGSFVSLSNFWPSDATRQANSARWRAYWSEEKIAAVRRDLAAAAEPYGFAADAFEPFFANLKSPPKAEAPLGVLAALQDQFVARAGSQFQTLSYFADTDANVAALRTLRGEVPGVQIISRRSLGQAFAQAAVSEIKVIVGSGAALIVIFLLALTRSVRKAAIIMFPVACGMLVMLATMATLGLPMNVVTVITSILVIGLASDYGVFALYACENREPLFGHGMASMNVCAAATLVGTTALIFTRHPALHMIGVSLTAGLGAAYLVAFLVIPGLYFLREKASMTTITKSAGVMLLVFMLGGCTAEPFKRGTLPPLVRPDAAAIANAFDEAVPTTFTSDDTVVIQAPFRDDMAVLTVMKIDRAAGTFDLYGLSHTGVQLFNIAGTRDATEVRSAIPPLMQRKWILEAIGQDVGRMYFDLMPPPDAAVSVKSTVVRYRQKTPAGTVVFEFGGQPAVLLEKRLEGLFGDAWRVQYFDYRDVGGTLHPFGIVMDNGKYHYRLIVKSRGPTTQPQ